MNWTEVLISVPNNKTDEAAAIANMTVPHGIYIEDYSELEKDAMEIAHVDLIDEELISKDREKSIIHIYLPDTANVFENLAYLRERLSAANIDFRLENQTVDDADWNENWKKYFKAFTIGEKLAVCPSWETYDNTENRTVISLDPGAAFGTGSHATTSLCLGELEKITNSKSRVLDIGTGSGVLSILAFKFGAGRIVATDLDPCARDASSENMAANGLSDSDFTFIEGNLIDDERVQSDVGTGYDIAVANILAQVLIPLMPSVKKCLKPGGIYIMSGIIDDKEEEVINECAKCGFAVLEVSHQGEWVGVVARNA